MSRGLWSRYREYLNVNPSIGVSVDISRMDFDDDFFSVMDAPMRRAFSEMDALEQGAIANPDEGRLVGHYWLRDAARAPNAEIRRQIEENLARIRRFAADVHAGRVRGERDHFLNLLVIGIGGSALGPQFVASALTTPRDRMRPYFIDNTDPDGIDRTLSHLDGRLGDTLVVVISKAGGTKETRNGMLESAAAYRSAGLDFGRHAVAVTGAGSELDRHAVAEKWLERFPMWDWVGGRTSELSAVGLLPAALQGIDIVGLHQARSNPAALLALMWHYAGNGRGEKDMVVLPYKDRLELFSRYLQQLVMESLGKELDLDGRVVHQGIAVYGNKGSTDQHAYVQQLLDGLNNFFVTFIEVLRDRDRSSIEVEPQATAGDYLSGFLLGTRRALYEKGRQSITVTLSRVDARAVGTLIALYERAVGFYGSLIHVNAYHQPGVEAGKKAASDALALQRRLLMLLGSQPGTAFTVEKAAEAVGATDEAETIFKLLEHAVANIDHHIERLDGKTPFDASYRFNAL